MGYIDDATGNVFEKFHDYEGTVPAMDSFRLYVDKYGLPQIVHLDQHSTDKVTSPAKEEERQQIQMSQFEKAIRELGVKVIPANSPQAKGRVERLFGTLQDRLVKEIRLRGISTKEAANVFLRRYLSGLNKKFRVLAAGALYIAKSNRLQSPRRCDRDQRQDGPWNQSQIIPGGRALNHKI